MYEGMSSDQIRAIIQEAQIAYEEARNREATLEGERLARIQNSVNVLTALLGDPDDPPNITSISGVLQYSDSDLEQNAGLALRLAFQGMELLTKTVRDIAENIV